MEYELNSSNGNTVYIEFKSTGKFVVWAPDHVSKQDIDRLIRERGDWIRAQRSMVIKDIEQELNTPVPKLTEAQIRDLKEKAYGVFAERVAYFAPLVGVTYNKIRIGCQKTLWENAFQRAISLLTAFFF